MGDKEYLEKEIKLVEDKIIQKQALLQKVHKQEIIQVGIEIRELQIVLSYLLEMKERDFGV